MTKSIFTLTLIVVGTVFIIKDAMSAPQFGGQFGDINNNGTNLGGGGGSLSPGGLSNQTSSIPGSGYGGDYYANHSNETAPTSPSISSGSLNMQNSSLPTSTCDCNQLTNVQEIAPTGGAPGETPAGAVPGGDAASAAGESK